MPAVGDGPLPARSDGEGALATEQGRRNMLDQIERYSRRELCALVG